MNDPRSRNADHPFLDSAFCILQSASAFLLLLTLLAAAPATGQRLHSRETEFLNLIYYDEAHEYLTYHLARSFENSLNFHRRLFDYTPSEPVVLLMQDFGDYGHGGTSTVPWNYLSIGIEPFDYAYETMPANERMNWLMHHELVHVVATDKGSGSDLFWRRLFRGKVAPTAENPLSMFYSYLTSPRWYSPRWYHEGIAVFLETWMAGGIGRVLGGYDEMAFRTMVLDDAYFYDVVGLESEGTTIDFQVGQNSYLYGTRFVTYLAERYGPEQLLQWFDRAEGSERSYSAQFEKVYGLPLDEEWRKWIAWEREWQLQNLSRIREVPVTPQEPVHPETLGSVSRSHFDRERRRIYVAFVRPAEPAQVAAIDLASGKIVKLAEIDNPALYYVTSLAYDRKGDKLFYTSDNTRGWRDLEEIDLRTGRRRTLLEDNRTGDLVVHPDDQAIWGVQHHNGYSVIVRIPPPYDGWQTLARLDYGRDLFDLDLSPDGRTLTASMIDVTGSQRLVAMETERLLGGDLQYRVLHEFENNSPANFVFSPDGRHLYGTSYLTGVSNVFRWDFETEEMEALTNVETGLFRPLPFDGESLLAWRYTAAGFAPVSIPSEVLTDVNAIRYLGQEVANKHPVVKTWNAGSPARVNLEDATRYAGPYRPLQRVRMASVVPVVEGYKDAIAAGVRFHFADPLALHSIDVTAAVTEDDSLEEEERLHLKLSWNHAPWKLRLRWNATDFYDLFGPTKTSRKGHAASLAYHDYLVFDRPRTLEYTIAAAWYGGLDTLPEYQNVEAPFEEYSTVGANLRWSDLRGTIGSVESEKGTQWSLAADASRVGSEIIPKIHATYDRGWLLPIDHSSLWLRTAAGKAFGERENAFANFFFGGFGNNWVDWGPVQRYRKAESFPGLELNEAGGNDFAKATLEWTLPPVRFKRFGIPGLYSNWARLALFTGSLITDPGNDAHRSTARNAGAQVDVSLVLFSNLDATFSLGYAEAFREGTSSGEVMVSLKLLR